MRKRFLFIMTLLALSGKLEGQTFDLTDSTFKTGDVYQPESPLIFPFNKADLTKEIKEELDKVVDFLKKNKQIRLEIGVHTDMRIEDHYSKRLDVARAESMVKYMIDKGIDSNRLMAKGYGNSQPVVKEQAINQLKTEKEKEWAHSKNRRVTFRIL